MATMVDIGADKRIPCKLMAPLQEEYKGKAAILFIDVWKHSGQQARFGVRTIPTQIFYDREGAEINRHEGSISKGNILNVLKKAGVAVVQSAGPSDAGASRAIPCPLFPESYRLCDKENKTTSRSLPIN